MIFIVSTHSPYKKFPGNPIRSYRTQAPLKIVGEVTDWVRQTPGELQTWREKLANNKGDIINNFRIAFVLGKGRTQIITGVPMLHKCEFALLKSLCVIRESIPKKTK
jgi:hypothetical protein